MGGGIEGPAITRDSLGDSIGGGGPSGTVIKGGASIRGAAQKGAAGCVANVDSGAGCGCGAFCCTKTCRPSAAWNDKKPAGAVICGAGAVTKLGGANSSGAGAVVAKGWYASGSAGAVEYTTCCCGGKC